MRLKTLLKNLEKEGAVSLCDYLENFPNVLLKSETFQNACGVSSLEMENCYKLGYDHYHADRFQEAFEVFQTLVVFNPFVLKYWMGLAACSQLLGNYEKALQSYAVAALLDTQDPYPHFHAYECYLHMNDRIEGKKALDDAYRRAASNPAFAPLRQEILTLKGEKWLS